MGRRLVCQGMLFCTVGFGISSAAINHGHYAVAMGFLGIGLFGLAQYLAGMIYQGQGK